MAVGGLSELYDVKGPLGADFQAWSMASFVASLHAFSGVEVDAMERRIRVRPDPPGDWPRYSCRRQVGTTRFDLELHRDRSGVQTIRVLIGARVPHDARVPTVQAQGRSVEPRRLSTCNPHLDEIWVDVPWSGEVSVTVGAGSS
jgi:hypothetical protein